LLKGSRVRLDTAKGPITVGFWPASASNSGLRGNDINDAYLAALAFEHGATLVTADQDFGRFPELSLVDPVAGSPP
jgi:predicted nucleic acid-binding protein